MLDPIGNVFLNLVLFRNPHFQKTLFNIGATIYPLLNSIAHSALEVEKSAIRKMFRYLQVDGRFTSMAILNESMFKCFLIR